MGLSIITFLPRREKIEKLSENIVKIAFANESSTHSLIMVQAATQGKGIPGLMEHILHRMAFRNGLLPLIICFEESSIKNKR